MAEPEELPVEYVRGTVTVVSREIVVTGAAGAAGAVAGELEDATTGTAGAVRGELEDATTSALVRAETTGEDTGVVAAGVGTRVIVLGTLVIMPGFWFT